MELMTSKFSEIATSRNLITSFSFHKWTTDLHKSPLFLQSRLSDYFDIVSGFAFKSSDYVENGVKLLRIGDINKSGVIEYEGMNILPSEFEVQYKRFLIRENDIVIAMTGATIGKTGYVHDANEPVLLNQRVGILRPKKDVKFHPKFIYFLLKDTRFLQQIFINSMGKSQPNISPFDILNIRVPNVNFELQKIILEKVKQPELELNALVKSRLKDVDLINEVIYDELNFDWSEFERLKSKPKFNSSIKEFSNNIDCRFSFKFHNKAGQYIWDFLCAKTNKRIKDFISEPIVLGKGVSPKNYDDSGDYFYIAMSSVKNYKFETENSQRVSSEYSKLNLNKSVKLNDIILARSGEGTIGKVALIEDKDIKAIHSDFTQCIRFEHYEPKLAYFFMRSELFQYLIYTHKKGLGNNTNIFPSQIQEFPMPDWNKEKQLELVNRITTKLDEQYTIDKAIVEKQLEINKIINDTIFSN